MDNVLSMLGLAKRAGCVEIGEDPVGSAARMKKIRLILVAKDATPNTQRRASTFAKEGACLMTTLPCSKEELGGALGRTSCALVGISDIGFANAIVKKLVAIDEKSYSELSIALATKAKRAQERKSAQTKRDKSSKKNH